MLCVSDSLAYTADVYLFDDDMNRIGCSDSLKALGIRFSSTINGINISVKLKDAVGITASF